VDPGEALAVVLVIPARVGPTTSESRFAAFRKARARFGDHKSTDRRERT